MSTGPEHYAEAERLLAAPPGSRSAEWVAVRVAEVQVHATLALAAATGLNDAQEGMPVSDSLEWASVAGVAARAASKGGQ